MQIIFRKSFKRDLKKIKNRALLTTLRKLIKTIESAATLRDIPNCKKIQDVDTYCRIRLGDYRLGFKVDDDSVIYAIRSLHRRDMYRYFS